MGFAATTSEKVITLGAAAELVMSLKTLLDKKDLAQTITDAYALSETESAKAEEARGLIDSYESMIEQNSKQKSALDAWQTSLQADQDKLVKDKADFNAAMTTKNAAIDSAWATINSSKKDLDSRKTDLDSQALKITNDSSKLDDKKKQIDADAQTLANSQGAIDAKWQEVKTYEASLKARAAAIAEATKGI